MNKVSISTGFSRSHLLHTGLLLSEMDMLHTAVTPYGEESPIINLLLTSSLKKKNWDRIKINSKLRASTSLWPEIVFQTSRLLSSISTKSATYLEAKSFFAFREYGREVFKESRAYYESSVLFRAGFGSFDKSATSLMVCDASLAHPQTLKSLISDGRFGLQPRQELSRIDQLIVRDCERADKVIVNSDFVKDSFIFTGFPRDKIEVVYLPPLPTFQTFTRSKLFNGDRHFRILFVGTLEMRKGINLITELINRLDSFGIEYKLILVGKWLEDAKHFKSTILSSTNVTWIPWQNHSEILQLMSTSDVLILPTYAEGGARVVTEAMSVGLPVLTTLNAGSPITDGHDGFLLGLSSEDFADRIVELIHNPSTLESISKNSQSTIREKCDDTTYINNILRICQA
jgi:glycosyltransferase involved in cell wall biosynthesis